MSGGPPPPSQPRHPLLHLLLQLLLFLPGVTTAAPDLSQQVRMQQILRLEFIKENKNSTKKLTKKTTKKKGKFFSFFLGRFLGRERVFFLSFLFS